MRPYKTVAIIILLGFSVAGLILLFSGGRNDPVTTDLDPPIVREGTAVVENGVQYVDITARVGYAPRRIVAEKGRDTVIRIHTQNTYDCSSAVVIPSLGYEARLEPTGVAEVPVPAAKAQGTLEGLCSMGMYRFSVIFE